MSNLAIAEQPQGEVIDVVSHHFVGGVYAKEMRIKDGYMVKQHAHEYDHLSVLSQGCVIVEAEGVQTTYYAPAVIKIPAHVEHSVQTVNGPAHWLCIHKTDCEDIASVDEVLIEKQA
jgi:quercetin dioxygenase-like cupin family protein